MSGPLTPAMREYVEADISLAQRLVACPHFRWLPGMLDSLTGARCVALDDHGAPLFFALWDGEYGAVTLAGRHEPLPDLTDPGTQGCVLALVREAWGDEYMVDLIHCGHVWVNRKNEGRTVIFPSLVAALVAAAV